MLHNGQLIVDRDSVKKITAEPYRLPHNTVSVKLVDQLTGEKSTRNLRWDEHVTTEEPLEVNIGGMGKIRLELVQLADDEVRPLYRYKITDIAAGIDHEGTDLRLGAGGKPDNVKAADSLLDLLSAAGSAYMTEMEGGIDWENLDLFPLPVNDWAYQMNGEITMAQLELGGGLESGR